MEVAGIFLSAKRCYTLETQSDGRRKGRKSMIDTISKSQARLSLVDTKGSGTPNSPDRVRTMFGNDAGCFFGSAIQIVDSQCYTRLLQDRLALEDYFNAYCMCTQEQEDWQVQQAAISRSFFIGFFKSVQSPYGPCYRVLGQVRKGFSNLQLFRVTGFRASPTSQPLMRRLSPNTLLMVP
jgi:hypothetical protein